MKTDELIKRLEKIVAISNLTVDDLDPKHQYDRDYVVDNMYPIKLGKMLGALDVLISELKREEK